MRKPPEAALAHQRVHAREKARRGTAHRDTRKAWLVLQPAFWLPPAILLSRLTCKDSTKIRQGNTTEMLCKDPVKPARNKKPAPPPPKNKNYSLAGNGAQEPRRRPRPSGSHPTNSRPPHRHLLPPPRTLRLHQSPASRAQPLPSRTHAPYSASATLVNLSLDPEFADMANQV